MHRADNPLMRWNRTLLLICSFLSFCGAKALASDSKLDSGALASASRAGLTGTAVAGTLQGGRIQISVLPTSPGPEPIFEIGSISKVFTGLLLAQAVEAREVSLDSKIGSLLGGKIKFRSADVAGITLGQLITHTSCLPFLPQSPNTIPAASQLNSYTRSQLWDALGSASLKQRPPCASLYSNFGIAVLAELLAVREGRTWEELVQTRIAAPLGMRDTYVSSTSRERSLRLASGYVRDVPSRHLEMDAFAGAGGLRSTATDLLIFSRALLDGRRGPLGMAAERLVTEQAGFGSNGARIGYGVVFPTAPMRVWAHNGLTAGHVAEWIVWPERRVAVVILVSNLASPARGVARELIRTYR
jgi:serine-type D-Ala-D-Ala carboxypeptidase/endopeptidase